ncbi:MAG TPA: beta-ketoacyl-ACP synthase III [Acidimicrobiia bacterium]|nr:beta-ketoacyl-ACP synthase III [Acidimicrobiia bacterium]
MGSRIAGTGIAVPDTVVTNADLERLMDTTDEWIVSRTGVRERRLAAPGTGTADLAAQAGEQALADAGLVPDDVDLLVVATMTPDFYAPGSAPLVQDRMGLGPIPSFGIRQQCSGFVYGLDLADAYLAAGRAETALVIGAEVHAGIQPWSEGFRRVQSGGEVAGPEYDRNTRHRSWSVLFGDGAGAFVLSHHDTAGEGILGSRLRTDGSLFELIHVPALGSADQPFVDPAAVARDEHMPVMQGPMLYRQAVRRMPEVVQELLDDQGMELGDVDLVVAHQANERIVDGARKLLGLAEDAMPMNLDRYGNTTAGTLPILYHELRQAGRIDRGDLVCFVAFGAGAHWGATLYREPADA